MEKSAAANRSTLGTVALVVAIVGLAVVVLFGRSLIHEFRGMPGLERVNNAGVESKTERSFFPKAAHISRSAGTVLVHHDDVDVHYVFFAPNAVGTATSDSHSTHPLAWMDHGTFKLTEQQTFGYHRESTDPVHLQINGKEFDLRQGRVFVLHDDGTVEQRQIETSLATALDPDALAKVIAKKTTASDVKPACGPVIERELAAAPYRGNKTPWIWTKAAWCRRRTSSSTQ